MRELWVETSSRAPDYIHEDVALNCTRAYQTLWASPEVRYFTQVEKTLQLLEGVSSYTLPAEVMKMLNPVTLRGKQLLEVGEEANFFRPAVLGLSLAETGTPVIFHPHAQRELSGGADLVNISFEVKPTPDTEDTLTYFCSTHPPRFSACDLEVDEGDMPAPHEYFESCVLPLWRWYLTTCHWFDNPRLLPILQADYREAMIKLKLLDPSQDMDNPKTEPEAPQLPTARQQQ